MSTTQLQPLTSGGTQKLSEVARHVVQPAGIVSTGWPAVRDTCGRLQITFDPWQDGVGRLALAKRADGLYAADTVVISIPRQVGKTFLVGALIFALCIIHPGLTVIWTAHRFKTARETFTSLKLMALRSVMVPHVDPDAIHSAAGNESVLFRNGSRVLFGARERGGGRGFSEVDVLVLDEAQILTSNAMDDLVPTTNAARNPLILLTGTPPRPVDPGEVFTMLREEALAGESEGTLYVELSADRGADPNDREQWRRANPSFPHRTNERAMLRMMKNLTPASFLREGLGLWDEVVRHKAIITATEWAELAHVGPAGEVKPAALAVDMSHARALSIAACWAGETFVHVEEVWAGSDDAAAAEWVAARAGRRTPVAIDAMSPAASLIPQLKARQVQVVTTSATDMARACGMFYDDATARRLSHGGQQSLTDALSGARKRAIGKAGGWGWDRSDADVDIAPLVAATLARLAASWEKKRSGLGRVVGDRSASNRRAVVS